LNAAPGEQVLLGPQRPEPGLGEAVARLELPDAPVAVISAGWQEAEGDIADVEALVKRPLRDLRLYGRTEELLLANARFQAAYRARQDALMEQQRMYKLRLRHLMNAARQVLRSKAAPALLAAEQRHAIAQLRALDRHHLHRVESIHAEFAVESDPVVVAELEEHRNDIARTISECSAVIITGGNVIVLLNRLRLFALTDLLRDRRVVAWSAGAMALADRIVLFHDRTPEGRRDPEVLGAGLGLVRGHVFLPDARRRVSRKDPVRLSLFCRRFMPDACSLLDSGSLLHFRDGTLHGAIAAQRIKPTGGIGPVRIR